MNQKLLAAQKSVERRITLSAALLRDMGMSTEAYCRVALNALGRNPGLADVDVGSLELAFVAALESGLLPDGHEATIHPRGGKALFVPMIEGRIKLARRATPGLRLMTRTVHQGDKLEWREGMAPQLDHWPLVDPVDDTLTHAYAIAWVPGADGPEWECMTLSTLHRYRERSDAYQAFRSGRIKSTPWVTDYLEMCRKTPAGQLLKRLPKRPGDPPDEPETVTAAPPAAPEPPPIDVNPEPEPERKPARRRAKPKPAPEPAPAEEPPHSAESPFPEDV